MDGIQAAILSIKLRHLEEANLLRRERALQYNQAFERIEGVATPFEADYARHVYHVYAIRVQERDKVRRFLEEKGVGCGVHYPIPIHLQEAYRTLGYTAGNFPAADIFEIFFTIDAGSGNTAPLALVVRNAASRHQPQSGVKR